MCFCGGSHCRMVYVLFCDEYFQLLNLWEEHFIPTKYYSDESKVPQDWQC